MLITSTQAKAIRRKQADKKLTAKQAGEEIGVTQVTYRKIRDGGEVKPSIYQKAMEWLAEDRSPIPPSTAPYLGTLGGGENRPTVGRRKNLL